MEACRTGEKRGREGRRRSTCHGVLALECGVGTGVVTATFLTVPNVWSQRSSTHLQANECSAREACLVLAFGRLLGLIGQQ